MVSLFAQFQRCVLISLSVPLLVAVSALKLTRGLLAPSLLCLYLILLGSIDQALGAQPRPVKKTTQAIRITQSHYFMGSELVTIAPDAIRIENTSQLRYTLVSKAPDWKVTVFRLDDKTYFTEDLKTFQDTGLLSDLLIGRKERTILDRPLRASTMMLNGFKIERLTSPWTTMKFMKLDGVASPSIEKILYATYKLPTNGGIPLAFTGTHGTADFITGMQNKGRREINLDTSKIERVSVAPSFFSPPSGFKRAASIRDVVSGHTNRKNSEAANIMLDK
jgi:hypothetical protein